MSLESESILLNQYDGMDKKFKHCPIAAGLYSSRSLSAECHRDGLFQQEGTRRCEVVPFGYRSRRKTVRQAQLHQ